MPAESLKRGSASKTVLSLRRSPKLGIRDLDFDGHDRSLVILIKVMSTNKGCDNSHDSRINVSDKSISIVGKSVQ